MPDSTVGQSERSSEATPSGLRYYECPKCHKRNGLWEGVDVPGWRALDDQLSPSNGGYLDREVYWEQATRDMSYGCGECGWEGRRSDLRYVVLGVDGKPLPEVHPDQGTLA